MKVTTLKMLYQLLILGFNERKKYHKKTTKKITNLVAKATLFSFPWMISQTSVDCMKTCNFIEERCVAKKQRHQLGLK